MRNEKENINLSEESFMEAVIYGVGIDVHKHSITAAIAEKQLGQIKIIKVQPFITNDSGYKQFWSFVSKYCPKAFVFEASGVYSNYFHKFLDRQNISSGLDARIVMLNPRIAKQMHFASTNHNDPVDAASLAYIAVMGITESLQESNKLNFDKSKELTRVHIKYVQDITRIKNRIKRLLDLSGIYLKKLKLDAIWAIYFIDALSEMNCTVNEAVNKVLQDDQVPKRSKTALKDRIHLWSKYENRSLEPEYKKLLDMLLLNLAVLNKCRVEVETLIDNLLVLNPYLRELANIVSSVPGIDIYSAVSIISEIGDISSFNNYRQFLNYSGLAPTIYRSGESSKTGSLNKKSNKFLRSIFYSAGKIITTVIKEQSDLKEYSERMRQRYRKGKIIYIKTAVKVGRIVFSLLKKNDRYQPLYESESVDFESLSLQTKKRYKKKKKSINKIANWVIRKREYLYDEVLERIKSTFSAD